MKSARWRRRGGVVVLLVAGAATGIALDDAWRGTGLALAALTVFVVLALCATFAELPQLDG